MRLLYLRAAAVLAIASVLACSSEDDPSPREDDDDGGVEYEIEAVIRRTAYGIPHISGEDLRSVAAGLGYVQAQDGICILADQILKVRGERARYLGRGPDDANVESDLVYVGLGLRARAESAYERQPPIVRDVMEGYVAGYNHYVATTSADELPAPCTGADWVKTVDAVDLSAYHADLALLDSLIPLLPYVAGAAPPAPARGDRTPSRRGVFPKLRRFNLGSNAWGLGQDLSTSGGGMLVANPHFPWEGGLRFHESHLTVPGELDVYGASLLGMPAINIGFNRRVAWTHTVTSAIHSTAYRLDLVDGNPTAYLREGQAVEMSSEQHTVEILEADGTIATATRTFWRSHLGPILSGPGIEWTDQVAYTLRDANETNTRFVEQWLRMNLAESLEELAEVDDSIHGVPWVNTIAASSDGRARFVDGSRVPRLSDETVEAYLAALQTDPLTQALAGNRIILLDGSTGRDDWIGLEDPTEGTIPASDAPALERTDFVMNANDVASYTNPAAPITGFSPMYGDPRDTLGARAHMNLALLTERGDSSAAGADGRFSLEELALAAFGNRSWMAERLRAPFVERCQGASTVDVDGTPVDISSACRVLSEWDGRFELDRSGAIVWRELLGFFGPEDRLDAGLLFAEGFDPDQPIDTPRGLAPPPASGPDPLLEALGRAVLNLEAAGIPVDARLGDVQRTRKGDRWIPIHGGIGYLEGVANAVNYDDSSNFTRLPRITRGEVIAEGTGLTADGYIVNNGSSFVLMTEFVDDGPRAVALLTYSESSDPASAHFSDQTELFSAKSFRPVLFDEEDIAADPALRTTELKIEKAP